MTEPAWVQHAVWWQVYPLGFVAASTVVGGHPSPLSPEHRLGRIIDWLDYAVELGASGIALGPIFESESHGYDTIDYYTIDARLGDDADFDRLIDEAHARGLRVLLDGVFNHVGRGFGPLQRALAGGTDAPEYSWFVAQPEGGAEGDDPGHPEFAVFEGHDALVELNHAEPAVREFVVDVMSHWLDRGADGWRLDAAYAVEADFWAEVLARVRNGHPNAYFVGEVLHGDYSAITAAAGFDAVTQYELWKAVWSSIHDANFFELDYALGRHNRYLEAFTPLTFVGNHDVTRLASAVDDRRHLAHALVVLLTAGGTPSIYYGDEQGFVGVKEQRAGGDDAVRPEFPAGGPSALAADGWPVYRVHQNLIGLRRRHSWLHTARTSALKLTNAFYAYEVVAAGAAAGAAGGSAGEPPVAADSAPESPVGSPVAGDAAAEGPVAGDAAAEGPVAGDAAAEGAVAGDAAAEGAVARDAAAAGAVGQRLVVLLNLGGDAVTLEVQGVSTVVAGACDLAAAQPGPSGVPPARDATVPAHGWAVLAP